MMFRRLLFPIALGVAGVGVLLWLGFWQLERLTWKEAVLSDIDTRLQAAAVPLPQAANEDEDEYRTVTLSGTPAGPELHVLTSGTSAGTGYRVIRGFETFRGRRILLDLGLIPLDEKSSEPTLIAAQVEGTLLWPDDVNDATPAPDLEKNIWFGRDVVAMSQALDTEPLLVVASAMDPAPRTTLLPIRSANIKNDHFEYALTWFGLAAVWAVMSLVLILRTLRQKDA